jgi:uncharacterized protein (TIGR02996 family)
VLLEAWRAQPAPQLAAVIETLALSLGAGVPVKGTTWAERTDRWLAIAARRDPLALAGLLATPFPSSYPARAATWLAGLANWPGDPRLTTGLVEILRRAGHLGDPRHGIVRGVLQLLAMQRDPRAAELLASLKPLRASTAVRAEIRAAQIRLARVTATPLDETAARLIASLAERLGDGGGAWREQAARLRASLVARSDDDQLHRVYADLILEHGDPRGELIILQCERAAGRATRASLRREKELLARHEVDWLGPVADALRRDGRGWARGFLRQVVVRRHAAGRLAHAVKHPEWAMVREVTLDRQRAMTAPGLAALSRLRVLHFLGAPFLSQLPDAPGLETLTVELTSTDDLAETAALALARFPQVRDLGLAVESVHSVEALLSVAGLSRLARLRLLVAGDRVGERLARACGRPPVEVVIAGLEVRRGEPPRWSVTIPRRDRDPLPGDVPSGTVRS